MIGQDVIPGYDPMPSRLLTAREISRWAEAKALYQDVFERTAALNLLAVNEALTWKFGQAHGIDTNTITAIDPLAITRRLQTLKSGVIKIREAMRQVEDLELAIDFRTDGDIDIVDPRQKSLQGDMGALLLIAAGVVVVGGLVAALYYYKKEADDLRPRYNNLLAATDKVFCDPNSPQTCAEWKQYKTEKGYTPRKTLANQVFEKIGKPIGGGLQLGAAAVIAFVALLVAMRFGGSKK